MAPFAYCHSKHVGSAGGEAGGWGRAGWVRVMAENTDDRAREQSGDRPSLTSVEGLSQVNVITVAEVASIMRVSKMSVYRMIHAGDLEAVRFGRAPGPEKAVHDYLKGSFFDVG